MPRVRPSLTPLEDRCTPAAFVVDRTTDDAADGTGNTGSLRYCVTQANLTAADDTITFDAALNGQTIAVADNLGIADEATAGTLTVTGPGADKLTVDGAGSTTSIFTVSAGGRGAINSLTLANAADGGAVVVSAGATLGLNDLAITGNTNTGSSGGGVNNLGNVTVDGCLIANNSATGTDATKSSGGGIYNAPGATAYVTNSTVTGNKANTSGGGVMNDNATAGAPTVTLVNCTVVANNSDADGDANGDGGGLYIAFGGDTKASNTILAGNTSGTANPTPSDVGAVGGTLTDSKNNIVSDAASAGGLVAGTDGNQVGVGVDQVIDLNGGLVNLGGGTKAFNLVVGSAALDAGSNALAVDSTNAALTDDQRGTPFLRVAPAGGTVDVGAVEQQTAPAGQPPVPGPAAVPAAVVGYPLYAAGPGGTNGVVKLYTGGAQVASLGDTFPGFTGGVRTAVGDFNGDGTPDVAVVTGPGVAAKMKVYDGKTLAVLFNGQVFDGFTGGLFVAAGDVTGDGKDDVILTPDQGGGPRVVILSGNGFGQVASFFGITDPNFRGGARAGVGDMNGDGRVDLVVSAGFQGGPRVAGFDGKSIAAGAPKKLFNDFFAFENTLRNGAFVTLGDVDGDGKADLIAGAGPGGGPRVTVFSAAGVLAGKGNAAPVLANFFGGDSANRDGIRVAVKNLDNDDKADVVVGAGGGSTKVTGYNGKDLTPGAAPKAFDLTAFDGLTSGVFVG